MWTNSDNAYMAMWCYTFRMKKRDVSVLILRHGSKILLQKRSKTAIRFPDMWGLFGGGVDLGETPEKALCREISEELALNISEPKLLKVYPYELDETRELGLVYAYEVFYKDQNLELNEGQEMLWIEPKDALKMKLHPVYFRIISDIV